MTPEGKLVSYFVKRVKALDGLQRKVEWVARRGAPDRIVFFSGGVYAFFELKREGGKLSKLQEVEIDRLRQRGARVYVCDTKESVDAALKELKSGDVRA